MKFLHAFDVDEVTFYNDGETEGGVSTISLATTAMPLTIPCMSPSLQAHSSANEDLKVSTSAAGIDLLTSRSVTQLPPLPSVASADSSLEPRCNRRRSTIQQRQRNAGKAYVSRYTTQQVRERKIGRPCNCGCFNSIGT